MIPELEKINADEVAKVQSQKLRELVFYTYKNSTYYRSKYDALGVVPDAIKNIDDLQKLPLTTKDDLQKFNDDFICVNRSQIADYVTTSGTSGRPVTFALSDKDLDRLAYNEFLSLTCAGVTTDDVVQLTTTIDKRFMAGLAYFLGIRKIGASVIRVGAGVPELQWDSIHRFEPTYLIAVPSFILKLIEYAEANGIDVNKSSLKGIVCIGEPIRNQNFQPNPLAKKILDKWDINLYSTYASTEMSTSFTECKYQKGGHHHPELIIVEVLDEDNNPVLPGAYGEMVVTTLDVEAMPLIRFKTGDIVRLEEGACECGRTSKRVSPVFGRKNQMIKYKGTTLYPPAIIDLLNDIEEISDNVVELSTNDIGTDSLLVKVYSTHDRESLKQKIQSHFRSQLRVTPEITFVSKEELDAIKHNENQRKPIVFLDKREKNLIK